MGVGLNGGVAVAVGVGVGVGVAHGGAAARMPMSASVGGAVPGASHRRISSWVDGGSLRHTDFVLRKPYRDVMEVYDLHDEELGVGQFGVIRSCAHRMNEELLACKTISKDRIAVSGAAGGGGGGGGMTKERMWWPTTVRDVVVVLVVVNVVMGLVMTVVVFVSVVVPVVAAKPPDVEVRTPPASGLGSSVRNLHLPTRFFHFLVSCGSALRMQRTCARRFSSCSS